MESAHTQSDPEARRHSRPPRAGRGQRQPVARARSVSGAPRVRFSSQVETRNITDDHDEQHQHGAIVSSGRATIGPQVPPQFPRGLRRLRDRLQHQEDRLRLDVNALRQEIVDLNVQRLVLNTKSAVQRRLLLQTSVEVVVEYFGAFQHGWILESATSDDQIAELQASLGETPGFAMVRSPRQEREQVAFLRERQRLLMDRQQHFVATALDPAMTSGPFVLGVDAFVRQWKRYSQHHRLPRLTLTCMTCHGSADEPIVIALGTYSGTLTHQALEEAFPRALADPRFAKRLVGAAIRYPSREIFHFGQTGLIKRYDRGLDYVQAFASLLENLEDVAVVLDGARPWSDDEGGDTRTQALGQSSTDDGSTTGPISATSDEICEVSL